MDKEKIQELDIKIMEVIEMIAEGMDKGYEDEYVKALYIAKDSLVKLEKVEQIVSGWNNDASNSFSDMCKINEILKE